MLISDRITYLYFARPIGYLAFTERTVQPPDIDAPERGAIEKGNLPELWGSVARVASNCGSDRSLVVPTASETKFGNVLLKSGYSLPN